MFEIYALIPKVVEPINFDDSSDRLNEDINDSKIKVNEIEFINNDHKN